jgi:hypothetical protein
MTFVPAPGLLSMANSLDSIFGAAQTESEAPFHDMAPG